MNNEEMAINAFVNEMPSVKDVASVFLYGSFARGDYSKRHSDIDVVVFSRAKKVPALLKNKVEKIASKLNAEHKVRIHPEYQGMQAADEDKSLLRKLLEEGKLVYSSGMLAFGNKELGLRAFYLLEFHVGIRLMQIKVSQILHGRKSWYFYKGKKVIKSYPGLIDDKDIISMGNGRILVSRDKKKDIERIFGNLGVEYEIKKIVYSV
ncbi:MAG: nucleotidyltransferase domain-containing protein [Candidatus Nanoarchaeia archaeon]|nr:nucleotidyltransferase domain-containing protein [Candidatus Nanoarchaeia archaeon]